MKEDPKDFSLSEGKANLHASTKTKEGFVLEGTFSKERAEALLHAAKACPVNAITVFDLQTNQLLVSSNIAKKETYRELQAHYDDAKEFVLDPHGYFLIRINQEKKEIEVAFCSMKNTIELKVTGKTPIEIYQTILNKERLDIRKDHAAYLGRELEKAFLALHLGIPYVQDDELDFAKLRTRASS